MSDSNLDQNTAPVNWTRRVFLVTSASALSGLVLWARRKPRFVEASSSSTNLQEVTIVQFSDDGKRLRTAHVPKVVKTEDEWRKQLSANAFDITRRADTELAYSGKYWNLHEKGLYRCICCDNALFSSETKFDSGTGWPSFWAPIAKENVRMEKDTSFGMLRDAVSCTLCDAHLGHVFDDGPPPTGLRYCMNSASLRFVKRT
ncbi:MAG TPA: peptide-methionine (R)-S-oxide reductase MsrB [Terriglobales bacterium]|jgi:peptide-methionine (R)-S-oxide reductase|nr:peptide-methionine (R)-S-oxide reductase MsrB [Terriglobales bacterium]